MDTPGTSPTPEEITAYSKAFTDSLRMENEVIEQQLRKIVEMAMSSIGQLAKLVNTESSIQMDMQKAIQNLQAQSGQSIETVNTATSPDAQSPNNNTDSSSIPNDIGSETLAALKLSYANTVEAQRQIFVTAQATATMVLSTILSLGTAAIAAHTQRESASTSS